MKFDVVVYFKITQPAHLTKSKLLHHQSPELLDFLSK
uniref:Uncharacterized protein n=1 Tax=Lepeophtheirus salmonis TaxID=72036 RepID=A0A0K2UDS2_LEPSM